MTTLCHPAPGFTSSPLTKPLFLYLENEDSNAVFPVPWRKRGVAIVLTSLMHLVTGQLVLEALPSERPQTLTTSQTSWPGMTGLIPGAPPCLSTAPHPNLLPTWKLRDPLKMEARSCPLAQDPPESPPTTGRKSQRPCNDLQA